MKNFVSESDPLTRMSLDAGKRARRRRRNRSPIFQKSLSDLPEAAVVEEAEDLKNDLLPSVKEVVENGKQNENSHNEGKQTIFTSETTEFSQTDSKLPHEQDNNKCIESSQNKLQKFNANSETFKLNSSSSKNPSSPRASSNNELGINTNRRRRRRGKPLNESFLQSNEATNLDLIEKIESITEDIITPKLPEDKGTPVTGSKIEKPSNLEDCEDKNDITEDLSTTNISENKSEHFENLDNSKSIQVLEGDSSEKYKDQEDLTTSDEVLITETETKHKRSDSIISFANKKISNKAVKSVRSVVKKVASVASGSSKLSSTHKKYKVQYKTGIPKSTHLSPKSPNVTRKNVKQPTVTRNETVKSKIPMSSGSKNNGNSSTLNSPISKHKMLTNNKKGNNVKVVSPSLNKTNRLNSSKQRVVSPTHLSRQKPTMNSKSNSKTTPLNMKNRNVRNTTGPKKPLTTLNRTKNEQVGKGNSKFQENRTPVKDTLTLPLNEQIKETNLSIPEKNTSKIKTPTKNFPLRKAPSSITLCSDSSSSVMMSPTPKRRPAQRMNRAAKLRMEQKAKKS